jgi:amidase
MDTYHRWMEVTVPASLLGLPTLAVPCGFDARGLPMGLQIIGAPGRDMEVLQLGQAWHRATGWPARRPPPESA